MVSSTIPGRSPQPARPLGGRDLDRRSDQDERTGRFEGFLI